MTYPLIFLALMCLWIGAMFGPFQDYLGHWTPLKLGIDASIAIVSTAVVFVGYGIAWWVYIQGGIPRAEALKTRFAPIHKLLTNLYYFDHFYLWVVRVVQQGIATLCKLFEEWVIVKGLVGIPTRFTRWVADKSRRLQVGRVNFYAYCFLGGVTVLFFILVLWGNG